MMRLHRQRPIPAQQVRDLYSHAGWWPERTLAQIEKVLALAPAVGAWDGDRLVGFARLVTDGVFRAYVEDVVVHEQYRNQGIGRAMMDQLLTEINDSIVVSLFCKPGLVGYYEVRGFQPTNQVVLHRVRLRSRTET